MGALIIREVVQELLGRGLNGAKVLLLAGSRWAGQGLQAKCVEGCGADPGTWLGWECGWEEGEGAKPGQIEGAAALPGWAGGLEGQHYWGVLGGSASECCVAGS